MVQLFANLRIAPKILLAVDLLGMLSLALAMVEETSAAARNLSGEVAALSEQASKFNVVGAGRTVSIRTPAKPAARATDYVSPVRTLPVTAMTSGGGDWASF